MDRVSAGDVFFSYVNKEFRAVFVALGPVEAVPRPTSWPKPKVNSSPALGRQIPVSYLELPRPIPISAIAETVLRSLVDDYGPLDKNLDGNQGYLFTVKEPAAHVILAEIEKQATPQSLDEIIESSGSSITERLALKQSRIGQGAFRSALLDYWSRRCAVTGMSIPKLLRASHIKPWRDSNNRERLDPYNGLLLGPSYDAAFDAGFISFAENGELLVSKSLDQENMKRLGINDGFRLVGLSERHLFFLRHHRSYFGLE